MQNTVAMCIGSADGTLVATPCPSNCGCCRCSCPCSAQGSGADRSSAQQSGGTQQGQREAVDATGGGASTLCSSGWRRLQCSSSRRQCRCKQKRQEAEALTAALAWAGVAADCHFNAVALPHLAVSGDVVSITVDASSEIGHKSCALGLHMAWARRAAAPAPDHAGMPARVGSSGSRDGSLD